MYAQYIEDAIESVRAQPNAAQIEHVVVDGASPDGTTNILLNYPELIWCSEPDEGQSDALNKALSMSSGEIIGWLNADEYYLPDVLQTVEYAFKNSGADVVYGDAIYVDEHGRLLRLVAHHPFSSRVLRYYGPYIPSCSLFIRRQLLYADPWNISCSYLMDWDLYLALERMGARFEYVPKPFGAFRVHESRVTAQPLDRNAPERLDVQDRYGIPSYGLTRSLHRSSARVVRASKKAMTGGYQRERAYARKSGSNTRWWD